MGKVRIPYYVVKRNGRGFWQPTSTMRAQGFASVPCGPDGPAAWSVAQAAYERWLRHRQGQEAFLPALPIDASETFPRGSVGEAWQRYTKGREWQEKALTTRNKVWWPAWRKRIKPWFGDVDPNTVTMDVISNWRAEIVERDGVDPAHKAMKVWRRFWKVMVAMGYVAKSDPSLAITNHAPPPRRDRWTEGEVIRLVKQAVRDGWLPLAAIIATIWDTSFQPGDVRTLRARHLMMPEDGGIWFDRMRDGREKTGVAAIGTVSARTDRLIRAHLRQQGVELTAEAFLFRDRFGNPYHDYSLADDFAVIRGRVFPGEKRQMRDMRRSGAVEVIVGGGQAENLATKLANSVDESGRLWRTYVPVDRSAVDAADEARRKGRTILRRNGKGK